MPQNTILAQIATIAKQLEQQEAQNAQVLQNQDLGTQQQQQMSDL